MKFLALVAAAGVATQVAAKPTFVALIPGASNVPGVASVGHVDPNGGGPGNAFGADFAANSAKWSMELCYKDSDGDEQFNGAELGDPCCEWDAETNPMLSYETATAPGDKMSKQDPAIWADVKCANGEDPVTKYTAYMAGGATGGSGSEGAETTAPVAGSAADSSAAASTVPSPSPSSGAAQAAAAAATVTVAVAAYFM